jgi:hypothetical protein
MASRFAPPGAASSQPDPAGLHAAAARIGEVNACPAAVTRPDQQWKEMILSERASLECG